MSSHVHESVASLLAAFPPETTDATTFLEAQYNAGLAWIHAEPGRGGSGLERSQQSVVAALLGEAGAPQPDAGRNGIGLGMAAPTLLAYGTDQQKERYLRPLFTSQEVWCQLFSEPGAGSDLAAVSTQAVLERDVWRVNGQKVWTSGAHLADRAIMLARTDNLNKHGGLTYFVVDMRDPGVEVRPLRQITGEAEFNEVFLRDVQVPDSDRIGEVGQGWAVASTTLNNERVAIGGRPGRESGQVEPIAARWRREPQFQDPRLVDQLMTLWVQEEVLRLAGERFRQSLATGAPGPESSALKIAYARHNQMTTCFGLTTDPAQGLLYEDWTFRRSDEASFEGRDPGFRYLRAKGNSIEGGTSEILRNIIAERVLGLPRELKLPQGQRKATHRD